MARIDVTELWIGKRATDKLWSHGIDTDQVYAVLEGDWISLRNRPDRVAPYVLIGRDHQRRCLAIPIVPTEFPSVWEVITAWYCKPGEVARLRQRRRIMEPPTPSPYAATQEPLDDEERELMDSDTWDWDNPVEVVVSPNLLVELGIQLSIDEHRLIGRASRAEGITTHDFIKRSALAAARERAEMDDVAGAARAKSA
jgi:hypothetical protein